MFLEHTADAGVDADIVAAAANSLSAAVAAAGGGSPAVEEDIADRDLRDNAAAAVFVKEEEVLEDLEQTDQTDEP